MSLVAADQSPIRALLRADVQSTTASLRQFLKRSMWVGSTNRYASNVVERLKQDHPLSPERKRNLAQYIAASVFLHANDGWSYLGRSVACLMAGDAHRALHLAYYAELRAAISLLASAGVGIFDHQHFVINTPNGTSKLQSASGTHQIAWAALEFWSEQPSSGSLFAGIGAPEGRALEEWFLPHGRSWRHSPAGKAMVLAVGNGS